MSFANGSSMRFGVNYTPRQGWFHSWLDFDPARVRDDFQAIRSLGADHVRIFPLWPLLQPNRSLIRARGIEDVATTVAIAGECELDASVDVLQGHLSSFDFLPSWVSTWHRRNIFTDADVVGAEAELVRALATALRDLPNATGLTLGNEFIQFAAPRHPDRDVIDSDEAGAWLDTLLAAAGDTWPRGTHVLSHDDDIWFDDAHPFTPEHAVTRGAMTTVHSWVFGKVGPHYGRNAEELAWFARYLCEVADAWGDGERPVWLQEIGAPDNFVDAERAAQFLTDTVSILMGERGGGVSPNLTAITWWCSHDVSRELADFPALEHTLGLIDSDGRVKPIGEAFADAVKRWGGEAIVPTSSNRPTQTVSEEMSASRRSILAADTEFFDRWYQRSRAGEVAAIAMCHPVNREEEAAARHVLAHTT